MQEMSKFTAFKYRTPIEEYSDKQKEVVDIVRGIIKRVNENGLLQVEINKKVKEFTTQEVKFLF